MFPNKIAVISGDNTFSAKFDGTGDYMDITAVDLGTSNTISWWHKRTGAEDSVPQENLEIPIGSTGYGGGGYYVYWGVNVDDTFYVRIANATVYFNLGSTLFNALIGKWCHVVLVRTEQTKWKLYINGAVVDEEQTMGGTPAATVIDRIGAGSRGEAEPDSYDVEGLMDEVSLFTSVKSDADVLAMYNNGVPPNLIGASGIVHWWKFEENALDSIGTNHGTLVNVKFSTDSP